MTRLLAAAVMLVLAAGAPPVAAEQIDPTPEVRWGMTYEERRAYWTEGIARAAEIARENCGRPFFGTVCSPPSEAQ